MGGREQSLLLTVWSRAKEPVLPSVPSLSSLLMISSLCSEECCKSLGIIGLGKQFQPLFSSLRETAISALNFPGLPARDACACESKQKPPRVSFTLFSFVGKGQTKEPPSKYIFRTEFFRSLI